MKPNAMHNEVGTGDDVDNLCGILANAASWFNLRAQNIDAPEVGNSIVTLFGDNADIDRCIELLKALGYDQFTCAPYMQRAYYAGRMDVDVIAIAEALASF